MDFETDICVDFCRESHLWAKMKEEKEIEHSALYRRILAGAFVDSTGSTPGWFPEYLWRIIMNFLVLSFHNRTDCMVRQSVYSIIFFT